MELSQIITLISDPKKLKEKIIGEKPEIDPLVGMYDIKNHDVMSTSKRPMRTVKKTYMDEGVVKSMDYLQDVARMAMPMQKFIVKMIANFLCAIPIELEAVITNETDQKLYDVLKKTWHDNKMEYNAKVLAEKMMADTEVGVLWYTEDADKDYWKGTANEGRPHKARMKIINSDGGATLYPTFNQYGDLIAMSRSYKLKSEEGADVDHFDVYTAEKNYFFETVGGIMKASERKLKDDKTATEEINMAKKIPWQYWSQPKTEWSDVQALINGKEILYSNHCETNKYFAFPLAVFKGTVESLPDRDENGKAIELTGEGAFAQYLTYDNSPESAKLEMVNLDTAIEMFTGVPFITLERMKSVGAESGSALTMLFMPAHLKASEKEGIFGEGMQRLINYLKALLCEINQSLKPSINMVIKPKFTYFLPKNQKEVVEILARAKEAGMISQETMVLKSGLVEDGKEEFEKIKEEAKAAPVPPVPPIVKEDPLKIAS